MNMLTYLFSLFRFTFHHLFKENEVYLSKIFFSIKFCTTLTQKDHTQRLWLKIDWYSCWFEMKCLVENRFKLFTWTHCYRYSLPFFTKNANSNFHYYWKKWSKILFCVRSDVFKQSENRILVHKYTIYEYEYVNVYYYFQ